MGNYLAVKRHSTLAVFVKSIKYVVHGLDKYMRALSGYINEK